MKIEAASGNRVRITVAANRAAMRVLKDLPAPNKVWAGLSMLFDPTPEALTYVQEHFPAMVWGNGMEDVTRSISEALMHRVEPIEQRPDFDFKTEPYSHQLEVFEISRDLEFYGLLMDPGTGKTKPLIDTSAYRWTKGDIDAHVVIAPNGVHRNWVKRELPVHMPDWVDHKAAYWAADMKKAEREAFDVAMQHGGLSTITFHIEAGSSKRGQEMVASVLRARKAMMTIDESTRIKNQDAKRSKFFVAMGLLAPIRRIATGTPAPNGPLGLFMQTEFLKPGALGFSNYWAFQAQYAIMRPLPGKSDRRGRPIRIVESYQNVDDLRSRLEPFTYRRTKDECLDLPPKVYERIPVRLTAEQRRHYDELTEELMTEIGDELVTAPIPIVKLTRHRQLVGGFLGDHIFNPNPKLNTLMEYLGDFDGKAIIWAHYRPEIEAIYQRIAQSNHFGPSTVVQYHGDISADKRDAAVDAIQELDSGVRFFVGQPRTGGIGLTLTGASTAFYFSNDYDLEVRIQSEDRIHRIGQREKTTIIDIVAEDTIDESALNALYNKTEIQKLVTGDSLKDWL